jgi:hypothetical protein
MVEVGVIGKGLARLAWVAARAFVGTLALLTLFGLVLAGLSYYALSDEPVYAAIAALVAVIESLAAGVVLGAKWAVVLALVEGLRALALGRWAIRLIFERVLGVVGGAHGERGGVVVQSLERLPLDRAEHTVQNAVDGLVAAPAEGGWLRRKIRDRLLRLAGTYTLARFREEGARHGGVDLLRVQSDLEGRVDDLLLGKVRGGLWLWTAAVVLCLPILVAVQTYLVIAFIASRG